MRAHPLCLQALESRLAPAVTILGPTSARFTDVDGDTVTVKTTGGVFTAAQFTTVPGGAGEQLQRLDLSGGGFELANLTFAVKKAATGDGLVNVGAIDSTGRDLGTVTVPGDLGQIDAGDGDAAFPALKTLKVRSLGRYGTDTQPAGGSLDLNIRGALGSLVVTRDVVDVWVNVSDGADGTIGSVTIGGSLIGGASVNRGELYASGAMGPVKIAGDVLGGTALATGLIQSDGPMAGVTIGGSFVGGSGTNSGQIYSPSGIGGVTIGRNILGGTGFQTGEIATDGSLGKVTVGGSFVGGPAGNSGVIFCRGEMGPVKIAGDVRGGGLAGTSTSYARSALIENATGRIVSVTVGGSIISGIDTSTAGSLTENATIQAAAEIGFLKVGGSIVGNQNPNGDTPVVISARGQLVPGPTGDVAIGSLSVGGRVEYARILAGYDIDQVAKNADAQIGSVSVGGDWVASSLVAGAVDGGNGFGNAGDAKIAGAGTQDLASHVSKIGKVTIKGEAYGTPAGMAGADHYGFVAQELGSLVVGGRKFTFTTGAGTDTTGLAVGLTGDLRAAEVAL
jgi:hypothetical protein